MMRNTALHISAKSGHLLIVKYLLDHGADTTLANAEARSAFELADESIEVTTNMAFINFKGRAEKREVI